MNTTSTNITPDALAVNARDAAGLLNISRAQFFKLHSAGKVPRPVRLGSRAPRWIVQELKDWTIAGCPSREVWERMKREARR